MLGLFSNHMVARARTEEVLTHCAKVAAEVPAAPTVASVTAGPGNVTVEITPPTSNGGAPIGSYRATCTPNDGGLTKSGYASSTRVIVRGLTVGRTYTCTATAGTRVGFGPASAPSDTVVPLPA